MSFPIDVNTCKELSGVLLFVVLFGSTNLIVTVLSLFMFLFSIYFPRSNTIFPFVPEIYVAYGVFTLLFIYPNFSALIKSFHESVCTGVDIPAT